MSKYDDRLKDYVQVNERIIAFYEKHPEGSLQSEITHLTDKLVVVKAWAFRSPADLQPGIGHSSLGIPGTTPYTRGSEVENAETSAWGRAIAALGFEVKKGIASREEVENKQEESPTPQNGSNREPGASVRNGGGMEDALRSARDSLRDKATKICGGKEEGAAWLKIEFSKRAITWLGANLIQLAEISTELSSIEQAANTPAEDDDIPF